MLRTFLIIIAALIIVIGGFVVYQQYIMVPATDTLTSTDAGAAPGSDIISLLNKLPTDLNTGILTNPAYTALVDGTVQLQPLPAGKSNPFAPLTSTATTRSKKK